MFSSRLYETVPEIAYDDVDDLFTLMCDNEYLMTVDSINTS